MGWLVLSILVLAVIALMWRFAGLRGERLELLAAALLLGVAGYAWQGSPTLAGSPTPPKGEEAQPDSEFALERTKLLDRFGGDAQILDAADAMHRSGLDAYAIALIRGGLEKRPQSADLWVGMGNALTLYADGMVTPAAELAFSRAAGIAPDHPGPPYFMGLALAQSGQVDRAAAIWRALLARAPADAPWRKDVEQRLAEIGS